MSDDRLISVMLRYWRLCPLSVTTSQECTSLAILHFVFRRAVPLPPELCPIGRCALIEI